jgi:ABC-type antimicrobial peptide transport system, permease component
MNFRDRLAYAFTALRGARLRSGLMLLAMAIGVAAVVVLSALGEGARRYVVGEFSSLGTHLLIVLPGRNETTGGAPPLVSETPRDLSLEDAEALKRSRHVRLVAPINVGAATVSWGGRERDGVIMGASHEIYEVRHFTMAQGSFLPPGDVHHPQPVAVLGARLKRELFGVEPALGARIRIGDRRFRVIGVLQEQGQSLGMNTDDLAIIPVTAAQSLFNVNSLFRILVEAQSREAIEPARRHVIATLKARHDGEEDVTVITQESVLATFDRILGALTMTVAGIAAISLVVAGVLIMNVMLVAVAQRTAEIGLLKALGAPARAIQRLFLTEAALLSLLGATIGLAIGQASTAVLRHLYPKLPFGAPLWAIAAAILVALGTGLAFGVLPARRAARLDPVQALAKR